MNKITVFLKPSGESERLVLDYENSILLPTFDTISILKNKSILKITVRLFLLETNNENNIHITINPFDLNTSMVDDGLSSHITPIPKNYIDFHLPRELFEEMVGSTKRLMIRSVDKDVRLVFSGSDVTGTSNDPSLVVTYFDNINIDPQPLSSLVKDYKFINIRIDNSQIHFGLGNNLPNQDTGQINWTKWGTILTGLSILVVILLWLAN